MTDQQRPLPNAPFPAPPPFWKHFTAENIAKLKAIDDAPEDSEHSKPILPLDLQYLRPPSPPAENYTIFGENQTVGLPPRNLYKESPLTSITQLSANLPSLGDLQL